MDLEKKPLIAGNWKMNKTAKEAIEFIQDLGGKITEFDVQVYLSVPYTFISGASKAAENTKVVIGAQNMNDAKKGAFTGEIAGLMLKEAGADFVILGHSERRHIFKESDDFINKKVLRAIKDDLQPVLCVGETEEERENGEIQEVLKRQLVKGLSKVSVEDAENLIVAYEPVWAIGTGKTATPEIAQEAHLFIREILEEIFDKKTAGKIYVLYGGSVKEDNIALLMQKDDIDGALVGGASLEVESFFKIIENSRV